MSAQPRELRRFRQRLDGVERLQRFEAVEGMNFAMR